MTLRTQTAPILFLTALCAPLFFTNLGGYDLWSPDEPRYGEVARNMLETGDPLRLVVNGEPYREKPPLFFWAIAAASIPFGDVSAATARFPSALAGLLTVLLVYRLARRMYGPQVALWAGVILATGMRFWWQARFAQIDMVLTLFMAIALTALWEWHQSRRGRWLVLLYAAIAAGLYAKGPPGLIFPVLALLAFYRPYPETRKRTHWVAGGVLASLPVLHWLWVASAAVRPDAHTEAGANLFRQTIGRAVLGVSKAAPPWEYLISLPVDLLPWALLLPWVIPWAWRNRNRDDATRLLLCWIVPAFILFSLMIGKRAIYLLPLLPAIAILMARSLTDLLDGDHARWRMRTLAVLGSVFVLAAAVLSASYWAAPEYRDTWWAAAPALIVVTLLAGVATLAIRTRDAGRLLPHAIAGAFVAIAFAASLTALPAFNVHKSTAYITAPVRALVRAGAEIEIYSVGFSREGYTFYSEQDHHERFTGLVAFEADLPLIDKLRLQKRLADAMADAAIAVPIEDVARLSGEDAQALYGAIEAIILEKGLDDDMTRRLRAGLQRDLHAFATEFGEGPPAFLYAQEQDWRWILALLPAARAWPVLDLRDVGSRRVLLIANDAGYALAREHGAAAAP